MNTSGAVLHFGPGGKLERIGLGGVANLLHECEWDIDLGGKVFRPAGWDECFPTIEPYGNYPVMGELVMHAPALMWEDKTVEQIWQADAYVARRRFEVVPPACVHMTFCVTNQASEPLEFLWASHALFGLKDLHAARWHSEGWQSDFEIDGSEEKLFVPGEHAVELVYPTYRLTLTTDQPWWGIWINRGGWPAHALAPLWCLGVEATNTPAEQPKGQLLTAGATFRGEVKLEVHSELPT
jgi:hypothetical protein